MKKWILRLLIVLTFLIGAILFALNVVSGTSDTQKKGLEQAFSQMTGGKASFGQLKAFNLFPQLTINIENLDISEVRGMGRITAQDFELGFGSLDLVFDRRMIEKLNIQKLHLDKDIYLPLALDLETIQIGGGEAKEVGALSFKGIYGGQPLQGQIDMIRQDGAPAKYSFSDHNPFVINVGPVQIKGLFSPYVDKGGKVSDLVLMASNPNGSRECLLLAEGQSVESAVFFHDIIADVSKIKKSNDFDIICNKFNMKDSAPQ